VVAFVLGCGFVLGCAHRGPIEAPLAQGDDNAPGEGAVLVRFEPRDDERWSLRAGDGKFVCALPCSYWVKPASGMVVKLEGSSGSTVDDTTSLPVPDALPARPGETVTLTVDRTHGLGTLGKIVAGPFAVVMGLMGIGFTAISIASLANGGKETTTQVSGGASATDPNTGATVSTNATETTHDTAAAWTGLAIGVGALAVAALCTYWFFHARQGGIEIGDTPASATATTARARARAHVWVTPFGLSGTF
jgi:hypothetical protein